MIDILLVNDDFMTCRQIINNILGSNYKIRISKIATNKEEALDFIIYENIDIVLLDLPKSEIIDIINNIPSNKIEKLRSSIIIISNEKTNKDLIDNSLIFYCFNKKADFRAISEKLNELIEYKDSEQKKIKQVILEELKYLGYNISHNGTRYLEETIWELYKNKDKYIDNLSKDIYPIIAKKYNKSTNNIKCNIIRATDCMYYECNIDRLKNYFKFCTDYKPKPKVVAFSILNKL